MNEWTREVSRVFLFLSRNARDFVEFVCIPGVDLL